jgi:hypothetical protein
VGDLFAWRNRQGDGILAIAEQSVDVTENTKGERETAPLFPGTALIDSDSGCNRNFLSDSTQVASPDRKQAVLDFRSQRRSIAG